MLVDRCVRGEDAYPAASPGTLRELGKSGTPHVQGYNELQTRRHCERAVPRLIRFRNAEELEARARARWILAVAARPSCEHAEARQKAHQKQRGKQLSLRADSHCTGAAIAAAALTGTTAVAVRSGIRSAGVLRRQCRTLDHHSIHVVRNSES